MSLDIFFEFEFEFELVWNAHSMSNNITNIQLVIQVSAPTPTALSFGCPVTYTFDPTFF